MVIIVSKYCYVDIEAFEDNIYVMCIATVLFASTYTCTDTIIGVCAPYT